MYRHLLVPIDGSELTTRLVTQAVEFAAALSARITFFSARDDYGASDGGALQRTLSPEAYSEESAGSANATLARARVAANAASVPCECVIRTGSRPYELILDVATEYGCDLIYMASHGRRGLRALMVGSQTQKVLNHTCLPVLVVAVEKNIQVDSGQASIQIIKREHRAIAAVNDSLRTFAESLRKNQVLTDLDLLEEMLLYIKTYPEVLHHPKEERYLFAKLSLRTDETAELIATLENEHREGGRLIEKIEGVIEQCRTDLPPPINSLADVIDCFVDAQWRHLNAEEKIIIPAAQEHLTDEDWAIIEKAFRENGETRVGGEHDLAYEQLFTRIMNRVQGD